jgi:hypothetical protein
VRLTRDSRLSAWGTWRGGPVVVVRAFVWVGRGSIIARGDVVIRPWAVRFVGCTWQRLRSGERIVFPGRAGENGPVPVFAFESEQIERCFQAAALSAFRRSAAASPLPGSADTKLLRLLAKPARTAAAASDGNQHSDRQQGEIT